MTNCKVLYFIIIILGKQQRNGSYLKIKNGLGKKALIEWIICGGWGYKSFRHTGKEDW